MGRLSPAGFSNVAWGCPGECAAGAAVIVEVNKFVVTGVAFRFCGP